MYGEDKRNIAIVGVVAVLVLLIAGGCYLADQNRKAQEAETKVKILAAGCETADGDHRANWWAANDQWNQTREVFLNTRQFQLGGLTSPESRSGDIQVICGQPLSDLWGILEGGGNKVAVYDTASYLLGRLTTIVSSPSVELSLALGGKSALEGAEVYAAVVVGRVFAPPSDAVAPIQAVTEYNTALGEIREGWRDMAKSLWSEATFQANMANSNLNLAYNHASSPTPTPMPTSTSMPTSEPPPTLAWSVNDNSEDTADDGSDSGSWDPPLDDTDGSDSGSWDPPLDDPDGSDSGSWDPPPGDTDGGDGGSWDPIIRRTRVR